MSTSPVEVYIAYAAADHELLQRLRIQLAAVERLGLIDAFHDAEIAVGTDREAAQLAALHRAPIIILLLSADFLASDFAYEKELEIALARAAAGTARVFPVLLRDCTWEYTPLAHLKVLPEGQIPVTDPHWQSPDRAFLRVVESVLESLQTERVDGEAASISSDPPAAYVGDSAPVEAATRSISIKGLEWMRRDWQVEEGTRALPAGFFDHQTALALVPPGWRLPTKAEWLALSLGDLKDLELGCSGLYDRGHPRDEGRKGYYWSGELSFAGEAWCYEWRGKELGRVESRYKHWALRCRYVR